MKTAITKTIICSLLTLVSAVPNMYSEVKCYYWFDSETDLSHATALTVSGNRLNLSVDTRSLPYGLHKISVMVESSDELSPALCRLFYKPEPLPENVSRKLTLNVDGIAVSEKVLSSNSEIMSVDASELSSGLHLLDCLLTGSDGKTTTTGQVLFYKPKPIPENVKYKLQINVDGSTVHEKNLSGLNEIITIDVSELPEGLHKLDCIMTTSAGECITTGQNLFYKPAAEMSRDDWEMTFFADGEPIWNGKLPEGESVVMLDTSSIKGGIAQLLCLFSSAQTEESYVAAKSDFYKPSDMPNSITGYLSESGSEYIGQNVATLGYSIETENSSDVDAEPVSSVEVSGILDPEIFNLSSFSMQKIKIGAKSLSLNGRKSFHERLDLRPEIDAVADIVCNFNETTGSVTWSIKSLDPVTFEKTEDKAHAILPANTDGWGMAEILYDVCLKDDLSDGTDIDNSVILSFDDAQIATSSWHNILDLSLPVSSIISVEETAGGYEFIINGSDKGSGIWKYELYRKSKIDNTWYRVMSDIYDTHFVYLTEDVSDTPQFATVAIDRAGNIEISAIMNSGIEEIPVETEDSDNDYYMLNGIKVPEGYKGVVITKGRKILRTNHSYK